MKIKYILSVTLISISCLAYGQNLNTAYFLDGFAYSHEINPAKDYDRPAYFSFPGMGNMNTSTRGNIALTDFLYQNPNGSGLVTAFHPSISTAEALDKFSSNNKILGDIRYDIASVGFHTKSAYHTINIGLRANVGLNVPYEMFEIAKEIQNKNYNFNDFGATATSWIEIAYGHSRNINEAIRVGGKLKFLIGTGYARLRMEDVSLNLENPREWTAALNATAEVGIKGFTWGDLEEKEYKTRNGKYNQIKFGNTDVDGFGVNGFGAALDLGAEWDFEKQGWLDGFKVGLSVLDFGFIKWNNVALAHNNGEAFSYQFQDLKVKDSEGGVKLGDQFDEISDRLSNLISLQDGGTTSKAKMLGATINVSAEYKMPFYRQLKAGLLSTTRIQGKYSWNEERIALAVSPLKWLEASGSVSFGTTGVGLGWVVNIHPRCFNLFVGMDYSVYTMTKQYIPKNSNSNFSFGINFPLGKKLD